MNDFTDLKEAVANGNKEQILELLKKKDVDLKTTDGKGDTLLHLAFRNASFDQQQLIEVLQIFLDRGNDINVKNKLGRTILHIAVERRMRDVVDFCLRRGADMNPRHKRRNSIAHFAIEEICRAFPKNALENTIAYENETSSFVDWMVSRGFDFFHTKNCFNSSPLYWANDLNVQHILLTLLRRVNDLPAEIGQTPLLRAFLEKNADRYPHENRCSGALNSIHPMCYESRYVFDIVRIILDKSKSLDDVTLDAALRSAIKNREKIYVIDLLAQRVKNVNLHGCYNESLVETFANSFDSVANDNWKVKVNMSILRSLIMKGADVNDRGRGKTLGSKLFTRHPTMEILKILKDASADFNLRSKNSDENFLFLISQKGHEAGMIDFVVNESSGSMNMNIVDSKGDTPLFIAVLFKNENATRELLEHGAKVNFLDKCGRSLIAMACTMGQMKILEVLIEYGADLNYRNKNGKTLLHMALDHPKVIELLLKNGVDVNTKDSIGKTPLVMACQQGLNEAQHILIEHGANLNYKDKDDKTLLHLAVLNNGVSELLLKSGLDVNAKDSSGKTPLHYALTDNLWPDGIVTRLVSYGARVDAVDKNGCTPLYDALCRDKVEAIEEWIRCGADIQDPKVFDFAIEDFKHPYSTKVPYKFRYLKQHLLKMTAAGLLDKVPYTRNGLGEELQTCYDQYQTGVQLLKTYFIDDCTSLYDLLHKDPNSRCAYVDNEKLTSFLKDMSNRGKFPNYFDLIQGFYKQAATRKSLLKLASSILNQLTKTDLPNSCTYLIFLHLSNVDIVRLIQVYEDSIRLKSTDRLSTYSSNNLLPIVKRERI